MEFIDITGDIDASCTSLNRAYTQPVQRKESSQEFQKTMRKLNYGNH